ncbi:fasciclin domain-containing protein [Candidatus Poriferisodalis sp.]|uniref:fasciclin domain-containing protein n=1 Tax=Candidatus Poriferisodalis sp. TaxID=3101277 RepID=UPI003B026B00
MRNPLSRLLAVLAAVSLVAAACGDDNDGVETATPAAPPATAEVMPPTTATAEEMPPTTATTEEMPPTTATAEEMPPTTATTEEMPPTTAAAEEPSVDQREGSPSSDEMPGTIVEVAVASGQFPTLVAAVQAAGLVDALNSSGPFTVLAPTEEAFAAALAALGTTPEALLADTELLTAVLTYHVLPLEAPAATVVTLDGQTVDTLQGAPVTITVDGDAVMINDANVLATDIEASNGIIHVIDTVLLPPSDE